MSKPGLDHRHRNKDGEISGKHGNALVRTLRKVYGQGFAAGYPETAKHGDATFARRATGDQRCRRTTILLRQAKLVTPIIVYVLSCAGRANRIDTFVQGWANDETTKLFCEGSNIVIALARGDFLEQFLDMPRRENHQHSNRLVR
jgi:hypothetical protein